MFLSGGAMCVKRSGGAYGLAFSPNVEGAFVLGPEVAFLAAFALARLLVATIMGLLVGESLLCHLQIITQIRCCLRTELGVPDFLRLSMLS
jgi:hypothetical protein